MIKSNLRELGLMATNKEMTQKVEKWFEQMAKRADEKKQVEKAYPAVKDGEKK